MTGGALPERAVLVSLRIRGKAEPDALSEFERLAASAGALVCGRVAGSRDRPDASNFIGKGKAEEIKLLVAAEGAALVLVNHELSPSQERNLEQQIGARVLDRTGLILDIFATRARSHEGKLQVELAQLEHLATRLVRGWTHLERQKGGIGLRGPGEKQLEVDRRLVRDRIGKLKERLLKVSASRRHRRRGRARIPIPTVALVGYTNAGKSTLFNRLSGAGVYAADQLFATLDPTMRRIELPGKRSAVLADTVGFIRDLPHDLIEAFKSTLEEVAEADLLLHVIDVSSPERIEQVARVRTVLDEIHAGDLPTLLVFNKIDATGEAPHVEHDGDGTVTSVWTSAHAGAGIPELVAAIASRLGDIRIPLTVTLPPTAGRLRAAIHARCQVTRERTLPDGRNVMDLLVDARQRTWLESDPDYPKAPLTRTRATIRRRNKQGAAGGVE